MVEKIDKNDPVSPYYIHASTEPRKDKGREGGSQRDTDEYSGSHAAPGWQKIYAASSNRRYLKLRREDVAKAWFRGTAMQRGISLVEADLELKDRRILKSAHIILPAREDFWTLKRFQPGQEVPLNMILKEPLLEISVPSPRPAVMQQNEKGTYARTDKKKDIKKMAIYAAIGLAALLLLILVISR